MTRTFRFFVLPSELQCILDSFIEEGHERLYVFPEARASGPIVPLESLDVAPKRILWFGRLPRQDLKIWSTPEAAKAGFVAIVRPVHDTTKKLLYLGELFIPPGIDGSAKTVFARIRKRVQVLLTDKFVPTLIADASVRSPMEVGVSDAARKAFDDGHDLAMWETHLVQRYLPVGGE